MLRPFVNHLIISNAERVRWMEYVLDRRRKVAPICTILFLLLLSNCFILVWSIRHRIPFWPYTAHLIALVLLNVAVLYHYFRQFLNLEVLKNARYSDEAIKQYINYL